jgi:hypothetical protein
LQLERPLPPTRNGGPVTEPFINSHFGFCERTEVLYFSFFFFFL